MNISQQWVFGEYHHSLSPPRRGKPSPAASQAPPFNGPIPTYVRTMPKTSKCGVKLGTTKDSWPFCEEFKKNPNPVEWKIYWSDYRNHPLLPKMWNQFLFKSNFWIPKGLGYVTKAQVDLSEFYGQPSPRSSNMSSFSSCVKWIGTSMITKSNGSSCLKRRRFQGHRLGVWERGPWGDTLQKHWLFGSSSLVFKTTVFRSEASVLVLSFSDQQLLHHLQPSKGSCHMQGTLSSP